MRNAEIKNVGRIVGRRKISRRKTAAFGGIFARRKKKKHFLR